MDEDNYFNVDSDENKKPDDFELEPTKMGFAVTSFVLSLVNVFCCVCGLSYIFVPLSLIFGIISLVKKRGGKAFAVTGIVISGISMCFMIYSEVRYGEFSRELAKDYLVFVQNDVKYISDYEETGEVPEEFRKYESSDYDRYWKEFGAEDFGQFYSYFIKWYKDMFLSEDSGGQQDKKDDGSVLVDI